MLDLMMMMKVRKKVLNKLRDIIKIENWKNKKIEKDWKKSKDKEKWLRKREKSKHKSKKSKRKNKKNY